MKSIQVREENKQYFSEQFILGFNTGARSQSEEDAKLERFAEWVADWILRKCFEDCAGGFAELACRRLEELGIMRKDGHYWVMNEAEKENV